MTTADNSFSLYRSLKSPVGPMDDCPDAMALMQTYLCGRKTIPVVGGGPTTLSPMESAHGIRATAAIRDISGRETAENYVAQMNGRFRELLEAAPDAMVVVNQGGEIVLVNVQAEKQFGYSRDELVGQNIRNIIPKGFAERVIADGTRNAADTRAQQIGTGIELFGRRKDGDEFPIEITLSLLESAEGMLVTAAIRNITERRRVEGEIKKLNQSLLDGNAELAAANEELDAFTYSVAHDLRAPLRHIRGFSKLLAVELSSTTNSAARAYLADIVGSTQKMGRMVDDLLALSRTGRHELKVELTGLNSLVAEALKEIRLETADRNIEWQIGDLPKIHCDPGLLKQVFTNLLSNAVKYTRPRKAAVISVGQVKGERPPTIFIRDNGVGFDMKYADKLFGVFQRLHRQEDFEGTGVGLATVQRIIHRHCGAIWAESKLDMGATFFFNLAVNPQEKRQRESMSANSQATLLMRS